MSSVLNCRLPAVPQSVFRKSLIALLLLSFFASSIPAQTTKRPLSSNDFDSWRNLQGTQISRDGKWVAYMMQPLEGSIEYFLHVLPRLSVHFLQVLRSTGSPSRLKCYFLNPLIRTTSFVDVPRETAICLPSREKSKEPIEPLVKFVICLDAVPSIGCAQILVTPVLFSA